MTYKANCVRMAKNLMAKAFQQYELSAQLEARGLMEDASMADYRADYYAGQASFYFRQSRQISRGFSS